MSTATAEAGYHTQPKKRGWFSRAMKWVGSVPAKVVSGVKKAWKWNFRVAKVSRKVIWGGIVRVGRLVAALVGLVIGVAAWLVAAVVIGVFLLVYNLVGMVRWIGSGMKQSFADYQTERLAFVVSAASEAWGLFSEDESDDADAYVDESDLREETFEPKYAVAYSVESGDARASAYITEEKYLDQFLLEFNDYDMRVEPWDDQEPGLAENFWVEPFHWVARDEDGEMRRKPYVEVPSEMLKTDSLRADYYRTNAQAALKANDIDGYNYWNARCYLRLNPEKFDRLDQAKSLLFTKDKRHWKPAATTEGLQDEANSISQSLRRAG